MKKISFALVMFAAAGCGDDNPGVDPKPDAAVVTPDTPSTACAVTPGAWSAPDFATNAAQALALRAQLDMITANAAAMDNAENNSTTSNITVGDLEALYNGGTPSLSSQVRSNFDPIVDDAFADFVAAIDAGPQDLVTTGVGWTPGTAGGVYGDRTAAFNIGGLELRQIVDKGLFAGGALYPYALKQTEGTITPATIDVLAAAWGSNATLDSTMGVRTDSANYSFAMGFHAPIAQTLTDAKAYAADPNCTAERDAAIVKFFRQWEQSQIARGFYYANDTDVDLGTAGSNDNAIDDALHQFGEGAGLIIGFYGMPDPATGPLANAGRKITDADLDAILTALRINRTDLSMSTVGSFVGDGTGAFATAIQTVADKLKQVYSLTDADIAAYKAATTPG